MQLIYPIRSYPLTLSRVNVVNGFAKEILINCLCGMKRKAHGTQKPRHIKRIVEVASTAQRSDSPAQAINQGFPKLSSIAMIIVIASNLIGCGGNGNNAQPQTYIVTFDSRSSSSVPSQSVQQGNPVSEPAEPTLAEHNFDGWYSEPERINRVIFPYAVTRNVTFYAKWNWTAGVQIYTVDDLKEAFGNGNGLEGSYRLERDIHFENHTWEPPGSMEEPFRGVFDGNGYKITGLRIEADSDNESLSEFVGFFRYVAGGEIRNLILDDVEISGGRNVGAIAGTMRDGKIINSSVTGNIYVFFESSDPLSFFYVSVGGMVGVVFNSEIIDYYSAIDITASAGTAAYVGGITGSANSGTIITNGYSTEDVTASAGSSAYAGGIAGRVSVDVTITNSYSTGDVAVSSEAGSSYAGGIAGFVLIDSIITDCYNTGDITASAGSDWSSAYAGGIAGRAFSSEIIDCYNTGEITAFSESGNSFVGDIAGRPFPDDAITIIPWYR